MILYGMLFKANLRIWGRCWTGKRKHWMFPRARPDQAPRSRRRWTPTSSDAALPQKLSPARRIPGFEGGVSEALYDQAHGFAVCCLEWSCCAPTGIWVIAQV